MFEPLPRSDKCGTPGNAGRGCCWRAGRRHALAACRGGFSRQLDHVKATRRKIPGEHLQILIKEATTIIGVFSSAISRLMNIALISERVPVQLTSTQATLTDKRAICCLSNLASMSRQSCLQARLLQPRSAVKRSRWIRTADCRLWIAVLQARREFGSQADKGEI
jgi:hypothetical protein